MIWHKEEGSRCAPENGNPQWVSEVSGLYHLSRKDSDKKFQVWERGSYENIMEDQ